jgi:Flp pilus assembly protein TadG
MPRVADRLRRDERGVVAVWVAIFSVVLFGIGAFAVDVARWYVEGARLQKAADSAALSGVVYLPGQVTRAQSTARDIADDNGWTIDGTDVTFDAQPVPTRPTRLQVRMSSEVQNTFARVLGVDATRITRSATADYAGPVPLGSPCNLFGRQDMESVVGGTTFPEANCLGAEKYWVNIAGSETNKARGDGYSSGWCTKADASDGGMDRCQLPAPYNASGWAPTKRNLDYDPNGYVFIVKPAVSGELLLQAYDIGWVATGDNCDAGLLSNTQAAGYANPFVPAAEAAQRYKRGNNPANPFCTGDTEMSGPEGDNGASGPVRTTVTVRAPSPNPWQPLDGATICSHTYPGWRPTTAKTALNGTAPGYDAGLARTFHRWMDPCAGAASASADHLSLTVQAGQEYSIQVQTRNGGGQNRFALRAQMAGAASGGVQIFAAGKVSLFNNVPAGVSTFNVVRLDSSTAGKVLNLQFFDLGDATAPVSATVLQPDRSTPFASCTGEGPTSGPLSSCSVTTRASTNGGKWQTIRIPVPSDYRCAADDNPSQCWVRIRLSTSSGQADTTTWSAGLDGDPVRLVQ